MTQSSQPAEDLVRFALGKFSSKGKIPHSESYHHCPPARKIAIRTQLLNWFDQHGRHLPWRVSFTTHLSQEELANRAYRVWVSEIMLQQTQVSTVIDYFNKWMEKWPTIQDLANATQEEVNQVWSGLGYYSRAKRLHESAQLVSTDMNGMLPSKAADLEAKIPGVGPYTAGAISSIAFNKRAPLVDGNVIRVFSRLFAVASNGKSKISSQFYWSMADELVDDERPGDFNQALMDLGATVCTPQNPECGSCPVSELCLAKSQVSAKAQLSNSSFFGNKIEDVKKSDIENDDEKDCNVCEVDIEDLQVTSYPPKVERKPSRQQVTSVTILHAKESNSFLLVKGPSRGLLANLWDFLNIVIYDEPEEPDSNGSLDTYFPERQGIVDERLSLLFSDWTSQTENTIERRVLGSITHIFSHIRRQMIVEYISIDRELSFPDELTATDAFYSTVATKVSTTTKSKKATKVSKDQEKEAATISLQWVSYEKLQGKELGVPVTFKKALALLTKQQGHGSKKRKGTTQRPDSDKKSKQLSLNTFFKGS